MMDRGLLELDRQTAYGIETALVWDPETGDVFLEVVPEERKEPRPTLAHSPGLWGVRTGATVSRTLLAGA